MARPRLATQPRRSSSMVALLAATVLLTGCDSVAPTLACKVEVDTPDLVADREAAGIAACDPAAWAVAGAGEEADLPDLELDCLGGETGASLADVRGPAVVNFWASNCGPCRTEMPVLQRFHEEYGDQVTVLGVDYLDTYPGAAIDLARRSGVTYPSLADACGDLQETDTPVAPGLPFFLFIGADGSVSPPHAGGVTTLEEIVTLTEERLGLDLAPAGGGAR